MAASIPDDCPSRHSTASMAFTAISAARLPLLPPLQARPLATLQTSHNVADQSLPLTGLLTLGSDPSPVFQTKPPSLLPGLLAATQTRLTPASDDELTNTTITMALRHGDTSRSAGRTNHRS